MTQEKIQRPTKEYVTSELMRGGIPLIGVWFKGKYLGTAKTINKVNKLMKKHAKGSK